MLQHRDLQGSNLLSSKGANAKRALCSSYRGANIGSISKGPSVGSTEGASKGASKEATYSGSQGASKEATCSAPREQSPSERPDLATEAQTVATCSSSRGPNSGFNMSNGANSSSFPKVPLDSSNEGASKGATPSGSKVANSPAQLQGSDCQGSNQLQPQRSKTLVLMRESQRSKQLRLQGTLSQLQRGSLQGSLQ
jgi:hypothetical protein